MKFHTRTEGSLPIVNLSGKSIHMLLPTYIHAGCILKHVRGDRVIHGKTADDLGSGR